jgi:hypothetical protein
MELEKLHSLMFSHAARNKLPILSSLEVLIANRDYEIVAFQLNL